MCTMIAMQAEMKGAGKGSSGWFPVKQATIGFDHPSHAVAEHSLLLDFVNHDLGPSARVALEIDIASGRALIEQLQAAIEAAENSGVTE
jgi:Family of unknown function (DUF6295)